MIRNKFEINHSFYNIIINHFENIKSGNIPKNNWLERIRTLYDNIRMRIDNYEVIESVFYYKAENSLFPIKDLYTLIGNKTEYRNITPIGLLYFDNKLVYINSISNNIYMGLNSDDIRKEFLKLFMITIRDISATDPMYNCKSFKNIRDMKNLYMIFLYNMPIYLTYFYGKYIGMSHEDILDSVKDVEVEDVSGNIVDLESRFNKYKENNIKYSLDPNMIGIQEYELQ